MSDNVEFATTLSEHDWDAALAGWRCSAVGIPGASVSLLVNGTKQDTERFSVIRTLRVIRWLGTVDQRPTLLSASGPAVVAVITLTKKLTPLSVPVVVALIGLTGTIASAVITANLRPNKTGAATRSGTDAHQASVAQRNRKLPINPSGGNTWAAEVDAARGNEVELARLGERAYKDGEFLRADQVFEQARRARTSGESDPYVPYHVAAMYKLSRDTDAQAALTKLSIRVNHAGSPERAEATLAALRDVISDLESYQRSWVTGSINTIEARLKMLEPSE